MSERQWKEVTAREYYADQQRASRFEIIDSVPRYYLEKEQVRIPRGWGSSISFKSKVSGKVYNYLLTSAGWINRLRNTIHPDDINRWANSGDYEVTIIERND